MASAYMKNLRLVVKKKKQQKFTPGAKPTNMITVIGNFSLPCGISQQSKHLSTCLHNLATHVRILIIGRVLLFEETFVIKILVKLCT